MKKLIVVAMMVLSGSAIADDCATLKLWETKPELWTESSPGRKAEVHASFKKACDEQLAAEAMKKRPGVKIGMTAKTVIEKTNWGEPESINRTITAKTVREQWVYGDGNYLYFTNGKLTSIQN